MRKLILPLLLAFVLGSATLGMIQIALGQGFAPSTVLLRETQSENVREIQAAPDGDTSRAPDIGFIDSPSATCYQPNPARDECFLTWYYLSVDAYPNYMITMTVTLNDTGPVGHTQGFFQTSMYVPYSMLGEGFQVACGPLGAGGRPSLGNAYGYTIRARDSGAYGSANYGSAFCPAYIP